MGWFSKKGNQDFGEYLPDDEATLKEENIIIEANSRPEAKKKCKEEADRYDGFDSEPEHTKNAREWNCKFKYWE